MPGVTTKRSPCVASLISLASLGEEITPSQPASSAFIGAMESKFLQRTFVSKISNILHIQAGEYGDGQ